MGSARQILAFLVAVSSFTATVCAQAPKLAFERIALHQFEDGPILDPGYEFVPGETAYFSCRIRGYQLARKEEQQSAKLVWHMQVLDPSGVPIEKEQSGGIESEVLSQDKDWLPKFLASFVVPAFAPTGTYRISIRLKDEVAGVEVSKDLAFRVRGHEVEPSDTLVTRNFQFLRSEDDKVPMHPAVYHPGDMLWARFDIAGYKFAAGNRFSVSYGLAIVNAEGTQVFGQPEAAGDSNQSFYPQRYVPGVLSLSLDQNVPKGSYTLLITVRDKTSNQISETRQAFEIQ